MINGLRRSAALALPLAFVLPLPSAWPQQPGGAATAAGGEAQPRKIDAWNEPLHGANYVAYDGHAAEDLPAAAGYGIRLLRLFLPGIDRAWPEDQDYFASEEYSRRLGVLDAVIQIAAANGMKVIVAGGTVPGSMYNWNDHGRGDRRLWQAHWRHHEFAGFWRRISERYAGNPAVIGYELLNEPHWEQSRDPGRWSRAFFADFAGQVRGTPGDLNLLYRRAVASIREVDRETPIVLDSGAWASPATFFYLEPIPGDDKIIYSFHWYSPQSFTVWRQNQGAAAYPGCVTEEEGLGPEQVKVAWNIEAHRLFMAEPVQAWQKEHAIPANRILCGEFSADRRAAGADAWNRDVITVLNENGWHWTYYIFRERAWNAKDFELGPLPDATTRSHTPMMRVFTQAMSGP
jgi:hypothetical protein